ncbi:right-handed parallel beta-helix repeat-containing protein [Fulvivirga sediminis]|uniref:Right-handed parallel beta-helix repeat-containing protein n=1 Tax=Fulvivirga sediminis TaxID=2803949 RepID=A0A937FD20_9BACT|nr:right-handed parallel beta-helix repeat-containing protein [Fulvivirga sediminis]MBL3658188.1 right-handed parallel beta-helix repeat-containing protein [Fulvivirga sediminis]
MLSIKNKTNQLVSVAFILFISSLFSCRSDDGLPRYQFEKGSPGCTNVLANNYNPEASINDGSCAPTDCSTCDFFISGSVYGFDGDKKGVKPGNVICLDAAVTYEKPISLSNIHGTAANPVIITNCGGQAIVDLPGKDYAIYIGKSSHFRVTGTGSNDHAFGIKLSNTKTQGISISDLSTNFEVDHMEIHDIGFAGIMAKTDPYCDPATQKGNFTMRDVKFHDNYIHETGGEGMYIGNSFFANGKKTSQCGVVYPHEIKGLEVARNRIINSGWESIQVGCATQGASIHDNHIEHYGRENKGSQNNAIQIGEGTGGLCFNNYIADGPGNGIIVLGLGDNVVFNNVIVSPGQNGIFCDERYTTGSGFSFINNTIVNPKVDGIKIYADKVDMNHIINNIIVNPGAFDQYEKDNTSKKGNDSYIHKLSDKVKIDLRNNYFTRDINSVLFNEGSIDFELTADSPLIGVGTDVSEFGINFDFKGNKRPQGTGFEPGAIETGY